MGRRRRFKQGFNRIDADFGQHRFCFGFGMGYVAHATHLSPGLAAVAIAVIGGGVHQSIKRGEVGRSDFDHPASAKGVGIDYFGRIFQIRIDFNDFTGKGGVDFGGGLDGFDFAE